MRSLIVPDSSGRRPTDRALIVRPTRPPKVPQRPSVQKLSKRRSWQIHPSSSPIGRPSHVRKPRASRRDLRGCPCCSPTGRTPTVYIFGRDLSLNFCFNLLYNAGIGVRCRQWEKCILLVGKIAIYTSFFRAYMDVCRPLREA